MSSPRDGGLRRTSSSLGGPPSGLRPLLPAARRAAQPCPVVAPLGDRVIDVGGRPHDHHVRLTERHAVKLLRAIGWVFVAGTPSKAPELIRPRRLDHLGGC
jgi:hypothetical protein